LLFDFGVEEVTEAPTLSPPPPCAASPEDAAPATSSAAARAPTVVSTAAAAAAAGSAPGAPNVINAAVEGKLLFLYCAASAFPFALGLGTPAAGLEVKLDAALGVVVV
jgi:hypothetical protein